MTETATTPTGPLILSTAIDLFAETGYEAASMRQIAMRVGVKPASLYNHYASKEEILWEIVHTAMRDLTERQQALFREVTTPEERLRGFVRMHAAFHAEHSLAAKISNSQLSSLSGEHFATIAGMRRTYEHALREALQEGVAAEIFAIPNIKVTSYAILEMGMGVSRWFRPEGPLSVQDICDLHEELALRMVQARTA